MVRRFHALKSVAPLKRSVGADGQTVEDCFHALKSVAPLKELAGGGWRLLVPGDTEYRYCINDKDTQRLCQHITPSVDARHLGDGHIIR